jgi:hypothetical protein
MGATRAHRRKGVDRMQICSSVLDCAGPRCSLLPPSYMVRPLSLVRTLSALWRSGWCVLRCWVESRCSVFGLYGVRRTSCSQYSAVGAGSPFPRPGRLLPARRTACFGRSGAKDRKVIDQDQATDPTAWFAGRGPAWALPRGRIKRPEQCMHAARM